MKFFFFQAEDGIRDPLVTGVQTCALPISPRRLSYRWHAFTPEWAAAYDRDEELRARLATEPRSKVTFELEPDGPLVKLTVIHDDFEPDSEVLRMVRNGWPRVIGDLKSLLERATGGGFTTQAVATA